ncbi:Uu.00g058660.m01.CDS01 [Anthostomella pinea]|uniref:Uu.00g058660.m01.CDS01 n=1 Tax=Anthostomella pinea TaxID=933095 RepID=A0AAI8VRZ4_9PEZI|nr:Uu.00g058660.m01.CDS01 [Anthostomella pinea]
MRSLADATTRWHETLKHGSSLADLQRAVKDNGPASPCIAGFRSICWKVVASIDRAFLLNQTTDTTNWSHAMLESRSTYSSRRDHFLKYIKHPEYLTAATLDPLADDADSPWNTLRLDEALRAEILLDVERLPDEPFYHQPRIQMLILDVLFIYCKLNPDVGGYRQGMHELLAPIVYVVEQDAIDPADAGSDASADLRMVEMLDASFIEHDAFALFSKVMDCAKAFYESTDSAGAATSVTFGRPSAKSSIVEKSQYIHEICLYKVDPELSMHLKHMEILPQVFLIRWIRLLFSREYPFDQMLILWDTLFSVDPSFELIDLVCTAMLLRIRWDLLEADYTVALQLLLKYPAPQAPHGPHTFIDDALYLRHHMDSNGGSELISKYTGKAPVPSATESRESRPATPMSFGPSMRKKLSGARSPLSPPRFNPPQGGVESLFQGAAKGVLQRGEKLGINQAVRDAMVEIRRNVTEARSSIKSGKDLFSEPGPNTAMRAVAVMDRRNGRLAAMIDESIASLKNIADSSLDDKLKAKNELELAIAKIQVVKVYLEDSTMDLPDEEEPEPTPVATPKPENAKAASEPLSDAVAAMALSTPMVVDSPDPDAAETPKAASPSSPAQTNPDAVDTEPMGSVVAKPIQTLQRPQPPIPTRSTLAQSSFSWMLEPDTSASSTPHTPKFPSSSSKSADSHRKRSAANNAARERTAFLFGEVPSDAQGNDINPDNIFGLEPIRKSKS